MEDLIEIKNKKTLTTNKAIFYWLRSALGIGLLSIPIIYKQLGIIPSIIFTIIAFYLNHKSCSLIYILSNELNVNSFDDLVKPFLNSKSLKIYQLFLVLDMGNVFMVYSLLSWNQILFLLEFIGFSFLEENSEKYFNYNFLIRTIFFVVLLIILIPFFLKKQLQNFELVSKFYLIIFVLILLTILIETPFFIYYKKDNYKLSFFKSIKIDIFENFTNILFSFYVQPLLFDFKNEIIDVSNKNLKKISFYSNLIIGFFCLFIGICGYLSLGDDINFPDLFNNRKSFMKYDYHMLIFNFFLGLMTLIGLPLFNVSLRNFSYILFNKEETNSNFKYFSLFPPFIFIAISHFYPYILNQIGFASAIICNFNGFIIIFAITISYYKNQRNVEIWICLFLMIFLALIYVINKIYQIFN